MKHLRLTFLIAICLFIFTFPVAQASEGTYCTNVRPNEKINSLSGVIFYSGSENYESDTKYGFSILNIKTMESQRFWGDENHPYKYNKYEVMSPDGMWFIVRQSEEFPTRTEDFWLYNMDKKQKKFLFTSPVRAYATHKWHWLDEKRLLIVWYEDNGGLAAEIIEPFANPVSIEKVSWISTFYKQFDNWVIDSYDPVRNVATLGVRLEQSYLHSAKDPFFIYDVLNKNLKPISKTSNLDGPKQISDFSTDGNLALLLPQQFDTSIQSYYEEMFISAYPYDKTFQISHFARDLGVVKILSVPQWSPDGKKLIIKMAVIRKEDDEFDMTNDSLYALKISTGKLTPLCITLPEDNSSFVWSPDSQYIAVRQNDNLIVVDVETGNFQMIRKDVYSIDGWNINFQDNDS